MRVGASSQFWVRGERSPHLGFVILLVAACAAWIALALAAPCPKASAAITHNLEPFSPLDGSAAGQGLTEANGVALDESTGNVFVTNGSRISILGGEGGSPAGLASPYEIAEGSLSLGSLPSLAYDNSSTSAARGTLYVFDAQTGAVRGYVRDPINKKYRPTGPEIEVLDPFIVYLSVDESGNLYVGNRTEIRKYSPARVFIETFDLSGVSPDREEEGYTVADQLGSLFTASASKVTGVLKFPAGSSGRPDPSVYSRLTETEAVWLSIDTTIDHLYAVSRGPSSIGEFDPSSGDLIDEFGRQTLNQYGQIAVNSATGRIYVADGSSAVDVFGSGAIVPTLTIGPASGVTGTKATLNGTIDPEELPVEECFFEWGEDADGMPSYDHQQPCDPLPPDDSQVHQVSGSISGLKPNGAVYHYRLFAQNANGVERTADRTFQTLDTVTTRAATDVGKESAILNGTLRPEGSQYTDCKFEWGLTTSAGFESSSPCNPEAEAIGPDFEPHAVSAALTGLKNNATYKFRLSGTNPSGSLKGRTLTFSTVGSPTVAAIRSGAADQTSATLEATINPRGFGTTYRFEWGLTSSYGHRVPAEFDPFAGSGTESLRVSARISGLSPGTLYHYRIVSTNSVGSTVTEDQTVETLNACGLPNGRCFELVSPRDVGPTDLPGVTSGSVELHFQPARRAGALAYVSEVGLPTATKGAETLSEALRGPDSWVSTQLSPALTSDSRLPSGSAVSSNYAALNEELTCGVVASTQPLTTDPGPNTTLEYSGANLYLQRQGGSYTAITRQTPSNLTAVSNEHSDELPGTLLTVRSLSDDCTKVVFETYYTYPGVASSPVGGNALHLYEWEAGVLSSVTVVPGSTDPELVSGEFNGSSSDGRRIVFSTSQGIFVREDGSSTREVISIDPSNPGTEPRFQYFSKDGRRVFFTAEAGLTSSSSFEGRDLYEYNLESDELRDRSATEEQGGAEVAGIIGASDDGARVYFVAQGQLVPGRGKSLTENRTDNTYTIFSEQASSVSYVATVEERDLGTLEFPVATPSAPGRGKRLSVQTARVAATGRYLVFEATGNISGYESGAVPQVYLFDASAGTEATSCISCRSDGAAPSPAGDTSRRLIASAQSVSLAQPRTLVESGSQPVVFFSSFDSLAPGSGYGHNDLYEWMHGQVFLIAAEPPELTPPGYAGVEPVRFAGTNNDGTDLYFATPQTLSWEDGDSRSSIYDARVGGGRPVPAVAAAPCDPAVEGSCQKESESPASLPSAATSGFVGPGNRKPPKRKARKKHHGKKHHGKKHHGRKRSSNHLRRAAK